MSRYSNTKISRKSLLPKQKKNVLHIISTDGDRLDNLAFQFYGDPNLWWYIAKANNLTSMNIPAGTSMRIPPSSEGAIGG